MSNATQYRVVAKDGSIWNDGIEAREVESQVMKAACATLTERVGYEIEPDFEGIEVTAVGPEIGVVGEWSVHVVHEARNPRFQRFGDPERASSQDEWIEVGDYTVKMGVEVDAETVTPC